MGEPNALPLGTILGHRYRIEEVLGRGGFAISYLASDVKYDLKVVIKELAPMGSSRDGSMRITFIGGKGQAMRLMGQFRQEVAILRKLQVRGVVQPLDAFDALGTSYFVMPYFQGSSTAEELVLRSGPMGIEACEELFNQLLKTLGQVHSLGILHRDVKPSNILISAEGDAFLIDFGSARQWLMDITQRQTVEFTPGFAAIEQLSENAKRGPGTDLYGLCASIIYLLTGKVPPVPGEEIPDLLNLRPGIRPEFAQAIEAGVHLRLSDRPKDAAEMQNILKPINVQPKRDLSYQELDEILFEARKVRISKRECPSCLGIMSSPGPAKDGTCMVCRNGRLEKRVFDSRTCPCCKFGILLRKLNEKPLRWCPSCGIGKLDRHARLLRKGTLNCQNCGEIFQETKAGMVNQQGEEKSILDWRIQSGRAAATWECDQCDAQLDVGDDGRWLLIQPEPTEFSALYPDEWARVASGAEPGAGNLRCESCGADYYSEDGKVTLVNYQKDPFSSGEDFLGQVVSESQMRWIAAGKRSGQPGCVCEECDTEFDQIGEGLALVHSRNPEIEHFFGEVMDRLNWRRIALGLPVLEAEEQIEATIESQLRAAWVEGELVEDVFWKATATIDGEAKPILAGSNGISLGKMLRKSHIKWSEIAECTANSATSLTILLKDGTTTDWQIEPQEISVKLERSQHEIALNAFDFADRCNTLITS